MGRGHLWKGTPLRQALRVVLAALALMVPLLFTTTTAEAAPARTHVPTVVKRDTAPRAAQSPVAVHLNNGAMANVDFQFWRGGWDVRFNWAETRQMSRGFSYCTAITALLPSVISRAASAACGVMWIYADVVTSRGDCVALWIPLSLINPTIYSWNCPH